MAMVRFTAIDAVKTQAQSQSCDNFRDGMDCRKEFRFVD